MSENSIDVQFSCRECGVMDCDPGACVYTLCADEACRHYRIEHLRGEGCGNADCPCREWREPQHAVFFEDCPQASQRTRSGRARRCKCGLCKMCGHPKHTSVHAGTNKSPDAPYGHYFEEQP